MIKVEEQGLMSKAADLLMLPIMYLMQFPSMAKPQRTHRWNNKKYNIEDIAYLDSSLFVSVAGDSFAVNRWFGFLPIFHMPIFGGWNKFVVLNPKVQQDCWFIGWVPGDNIGISRVKLIGSVKLLKGPQTVFFFGLNEHGEQIELDIVGGGEVLSDKKFSKLQFL